MSDPQQSALQIERTRLEGVRQTAHEQARRAHDEAVAAAVAAHADRRQKLAEVFEKARGTAAEDHARAAFEAIPVSLDLRLLRDQLGAAIHAADADFNQAVKAAGRRLGVGEN